MIEIKNFIEKCEKYGIDPYKHLAGFDLGDSAIERIVKTL